MIGDVDLLRDSACITVYYPVSSRRQDRGRATAAHEGSLGRPRSAGLMMRSPALASDRPRILIVEDDARLATLLSEYLSSQGFAVNAESHGDRAVERIWSENPAVVILDLMLPGTGGFEIAAGHASATRTAFSS